MMRAFLSIVFILAAAAVPAAPRVTATVVETPPETLASRARDAIRNGPAVSSDGFIEVYSNEPADQDGPGFRGPILQASSEECAALAKLVGLEMPSGSAGLVIYVGDGRTNDTRVIERGDSNVSGALLTRVYLPSPGFSDLDLFRRAVAAAWFRAWVARHASDDVGRPSAVPDWVIDGLLRNLDPATRLADQLFVIGLWQQGRLPFFPALAGSMRFARGRAQALDGFFVQWLLEARMPAADAAAAPAAGGSHGAFPAARRPHLSTTAFRRMLDSLAGGAPWSGAKMAAELSGVADPVAQDHALDERLVRAVRSVLSPGHPTPLDARTFAARLLLYPPFFDINFQNSSKCCDFHEAIALSENDLFVRVAAILKSQEIPIFAVGRGPELEKASEAYVLFLRELARGTKAARLADLLDDADAKLELAFEAAQENFKQ